MTQQPPGYPPQQPQFPQQYQQAPYQQQQPPYQQQPYQQQYQQGYQQQQPGYPAAGGPAPGQPQQPADVPRVAPAGSPYPVLVSTMNDLPGHRVDQVFGEVFGLTVRSRDIGSNFMASFRSLGGGEINEFTQMLAESRHVAVMRMCQMAQSMGANAILAMRFDCNEIAQTMSEVAAYGTAVIVRPPDSDTSDSVEDAEDAEDAEPEDAVDG